MNRFSPLIYKNKAQKYAWFFWESEPQYAYKLYINMYITAEGYGNIAKKSYQQKPFNFEEKYLG